MADDDDDTHPPSMDGDLPTSASASHHHSRDKGKAAAAQGIPFGQPLSRPASLDNIQEETSTSSSSADNRSSYHPQKHKQHHYHHQHTHKHKHHPKEPRSTVSSPGHRPHYHRPGYFPRRGPAGYYAATTAVQQDIVRLERDLERLFQRSTGQRTRRISTTTSSSPSIDLMEEHPQQQKRGLLFTARMSRGDDLAAALNEDVRQEDIQISTTLSSLLEILNKHKVASQLPLAGDVFGLLSIPFDRVPFNERDCEQALDIFDSIREHFRQLDPHENFEQILFCCRMMHIQHLKLKMRLVATLKIMLAPCMGNAHLLPSSFAAVHAFAYTLVDAIPRTSFTYTIDRPLSRHENETEHIKENLINWLDRLADGEVIPIVGKQWDNLHTLRGQDMVPPSVGRFCVAESLCLSLMAVSDSNTLVIKELLPRYWQEPDEQTVPAYTSVVYALTKVVSERLLAATEADVRQPDSTISLLLQFVQEKITPSVLTVTRSKAVKGNVIILLLALMSITSLCKDTPSARRPSSPRSSPQPSSVGDFLEDGSNSSLWAGEDAPDHLGIHSGQSRRASEQQQFITWCHSQRRYIESFWTEASQPVFIQVLQDVVTDGNWERLVRCYENLAFQLDEPMCHAFMNASLPQFLQRIAAEAPPYTPALSDLLARLSKAYRPLFYKSVVACTASDQEDTVARHLKLIISLQKYISGVQFWMHDAEMICVLLLSDVGKPSQESLLRPNPDEPAWGSTTLGQCIVAAEFMWTVRDLRAKQNDPQRDMEADEVAKKFLIDLERRLAVFMAAKEKTTLIPLPLRVLLCNIFLETRFFCNTTHRPGWLSRAMEWATQPVATSEFFQETRDQVRSSAILHHRYLDDVTLTFQRMQIVYASVVDQLDAVHSQEPSRRETQASPEVLLKVSLSEEDEEEEDTFQLPIQTRREASITAMYPITPAAAASLDISPGSTQYSASIAMAKFRLENLGSVNNDPFGAVFSLLVAVFTAMSSQDFSRMVQPLWERFIVDSNPRAFVPAAFLLMQCGERVPQQVVQAFSHEFYNEDPLSRYSAVEKISALSGFRFNILAQEYIPISSRKRPFRGDGGAFSTPFVPTDLGSNRFTMDEPRWMAKLKHASNFPIELKRQIQELGWDDDDQGEEHEALKKVLTPLCLLPSLYLEEEEEQPMNETENREPEQRQHSISKLIARRKRAATVQALTSTSLGMVDLLNDFSGGVGSSLREVFENAMRDDPALFLRPFLGDLGKERIERQKEVLTRLRHLVDLRCKLPPGFAFILFNYLAGMLKWLTRENKPDGLLLMTLIHPLLTELALSTNELSTRDLRKNKIEHLLTSTGRFWFRHEQPRDMFPRGITDTRTPFSILDIPWELFSVAMLRTSHVQFLTNFLTRYPREVYAVKKTLQGYEPMPIPGIGPRDESPYPRIELRKRRDTSFVFEAGDDQEDRYSDDHVPRPRHPQEQEDARLLAALRARVWLRFIDTLLVGLNKNYNDRLELEGILKGVNLIIMDYTADYGILGQALVLYTRIVTRFKRLFVSNRGYGTFLPALFKVFCEVEQHAHVRSAITFAWCRFYAVHEESFVFQMLGSLVPLILNAYNKSVSLGAWMTDNLFSLMQAMHNPPRLGATSDVLGLQLQVELDDHERSVQERIDAASNPMAMPLSTSLLKPLTKSITAPIVPLVVNNYANRPFLLQNFVKLFLTIIAYDPGSLRAEQFVKMLRHLLPRFCRLTNLNDLIAEGIAALVDVFVKFSKTAKPAGSTGGGGSGGGGGVQPETQSPNNANRGSHPSGAVPHINIQLPSFFDERDHGARTESTQHAYGKQWQQNDRLSIKREFVLLVHEFLKNRGTLTEANHEKMAQIIRITLHNYASVRSTVCPTDWIRDYLVDSLQSMVDMRNYTKSFKTMLSQIFGQYRAQWRSIDAADLYIGLAIVLEQGQGKAINMHDIAGVMKDKFVNFGLSIVTRDWEQSEDSHTRLCNALVRLIVAILENSTQDVLREIEQLPPSSILIGKIIIPVCLQYDLLLDYSSISLVRKYRPEPSANWMRLLAYISRACSQSALLKTRATGFSLSALTSTMSQTDDDASDEPKDKKKHTPIAIAQLFALSILAMKVILIRAQKSLDKIKGAWVQVAYFVRGALVFGQTLKHLRAKSSGTGSGRSTPRTGSFIGTPTFLDSQPQPIGVLYDYATWCFLEFTVSYKTPLAVFLRDFVQEKLYDMGSRSGVGSPRMRKKWQSWGHDVLSTSGDGAHTPASTSGGLGLHLPPASPRDALQLPSPTANYEPSSPQQQQQQQQPRSPAAESSGGGGRGHRDSHLMSVQLHALHAETLTAITHIQAALGYKHDYSAATTGQHRPWTYRTAVSKVSSEWRFVMDLSL
ncbi:hypothetical protein BCR43DRAFT_465218 [Syncephalastrum racemosum]|uniref:Protein UNC80 C-terminal domain-containing protein n=1 Tax=Syncephalastrum racemosum TaxID=13706 RepID=A0A1X2HT35_SYNRA|nr:hypothetical protein BCR43DRAFT_465218 [Syncephalastrum racemosum]